MSARRVLDWQRDAACLDIGYGAFTPDDSLSSSAAGAIYRESRVVCAGCPVTAECLEFALTEEGPATHDERTGLYGGLSPHERYELYKQRRHQTAA